MVEVLTWKPFKIFVPTTVKIWHHDVDFQATYFAHPGIEERMECPNKKVGEYFIHNEDVWARIIIEKDFGDTFTIESRLIDPDDGCGTRVCKDIVTLSEMKEYIDQHVKILNAWIRNIRNDNNTSISN